MYLFLCVYGAQKNKMHNHWVVTTRCDVLIDMPIYCSSTGSNLIWNEMHINWLEREKVGEWIVTYKISPVVKVANEGEDESC